jgi:hypothetical protein
MSRTRATSTSTSTSLGFAELLAPILTKGKPKVKPTSLAFFPWLSQNGSDELARWNTVLGSRSVRGGYRNELFAAHTVPFSRTLSVPDDGCRAARIRSVFLGASPILEDAEELWLAAWAPTAQGTSQVWASHQDDREIDCLDESIADFVMRQYSDDSYFNDPGDENAVTLTPELAALATAKECSTVGALLGPADLQPRTDWIVALFFPEADWYGIGNGADGMPTYADYRTDHERGARGLVARWPHHQAYWLMHHLAMDNRRALEELLPRVERSYAPSAELADLAAMVLQRATSLPKWWKAKRLAGFRETMREQRPEAFERAPSQSERGASTLQQAGIKTLKRNAIAAPRPAKLSSSLNSSPLDRVGLATSKRRF